MFVATATSRVGPTYAGMERLWHSSWRGCATGRGTSRAFGNIPL